MGRTDLMIEMERERNPDYERKLAAKYGSLDDFDVVLDRISSTAQASDVDILHRLSPMGNTYIHVAAKHGNADVVTCLARTNGSLILLKNSNGDTALHLAAKAGHDLIVKALVRVLDGEEDRKNELVRAINERGNTALHEALINCHLLYIPEYLIRGDPELLYYLNKEGESALYLAAKAGFANCVSLILELATDQERLKELFEKKSLIQAAIMGKNRGVLEALLNWNPSLQDGEGRNPLHHAALLGYLEEVRYLLDKYASSATQRDKIGLFPIHLASIKGHVDIINLLLQDSHADPCELLDSDGHSILHLALHLATMHWHPKIVNTLTWDKRVDIMSVNDKRMTALDTAEYYMRNNPKYHQVGTMSFTTK